MMECSPQPSTVRYEIHRRTEPQNTMINERSGNLGLQEYRGFIVIFAKYCSVRNLTSK
jgi:hypothetical protein